MQPPALPGRLDHLAHPAPGRPAELPFGPRGRGDRARCVAGTARLDERGSPVAGHLAHQVDEFADRNALAAADVHGQVARGAPGEAPGGREVRVGEIGDMDVVPHAGAVRVG